MHLYVNSAFINTLQGFLIHVLKTHIVWHFCLQIVGNAGNLRMGRQLDKTTSCFTLYFQKQNLLLFTHVDCETYEMVKVY